MLSHAVGDQELGLLRPSVATLGEANLLFTERLAVGRGGVVLVRRAIADVTVEDDQRGAPRRLSEDGERVPDAPEGVGITHPKDLPSVCDKSRCEVLRRGPAPG